MSDVNLELSRAAGTTISLNDTIVRNLAGVASGTISMDNLRGKSAYTPMSLGYTGGLGQAFGACKTVSTTVAVSVSGGIGPYSFVWTRTSGFSTPSSRTATISGTNSGTDVVTISQYLCPGGESNSSYSVVVTDSTSATASITVNCGFIHFG
jgi:hypothetical protein